MERSRRIWLRHQERDPVQTGRSLWGSAGGSLRSRDLNAHTVRR